MTRRCEQDFTAKTWRNAGGGASLLQQTIWISKQMRLKFNEKFNTDNNNNNIIINIIHAANSSFHSTYLVSSETLNLNSIKFDCAFPNHFGPGAVPAFGSWWRGPEMHWPWASLGAEGTESRPRPIDADGVDSKTLKASREWGTRVVISVLWVTPHLRRWCCGWWLGREKNKSRISRACSTMVSR